MSKREREFFVDNLLVRIHFIIEMTWWTGLAPWEFKYLFFSSGFLRKLCVICAVAREREFFIENLLVRIHSNIEII